MCGRVVCAGPILFNQYIALALQTDSYSVLSILYGLHLKYYNNVQDYWEKYGMVLTGGSFA